MIKVERGSAPAFTLETAFTLAREEYERFQCLGGSRTYQSSADVTSALGGYARQATGYVHELFRGKCAYTEVWVRDNLHLHLHRPEADAHDDDLPWAPRHYWWTAMWYRNWYSASPEVASLKRNLFPVIGERAPEPVDLESLTSDVPERFLDRGVLLDPCEDEPLLHLKFTPDGQVKAWSDEAASWLIGDERRRGPETIRLLDLNNAGLVAARRSAYAAATGSKRASTPGRARAVADDAPHAGARRQLLAARLLDPSPTDLTPELGEVLPELVPLILATPGRFSPAFVAQVRLALAPTRQELADHLTDHGAPAQSPEPPAEGGPAPEPDATEPPPPKSSVASVGPRSSIPPTAVLTRISITNVQAIQRCVIDVPLAVQSPTGSERARSALHGISSLTPSVTIGSHARPWRVFLGENGSGKSSALRAIALALAGRDVDELVNAAGLAWPDLLRRGSRRAQVRLEFTGGCVVDLQFTAAGPTAQSRASLPRIDAYVRGFGATRLNSRGGQAHGGNLRLGNLFDPLQPVIDAQQWLLDLARREDQGDFNVAAVCLARLLGRQDELTAPNAAAHPFLRRSGKDILVADEPLRTLSDGYQAIITLACDLMAGAGQGLSDMRNATGIVLIDELGCYLHPRWKMQITRTLRDVFPSMQFLVTTHEPLCLRGLVGREVVRVTRSDTDSTRRMRRWQAEFEEIEQSPSDYRVDRLLTSSFFGLDTTIDPEVELDFQEYYALIRRPGLEPDEARRRDDLRAQLSRHGILGYTARDQLVYDAIDLFLAQNATLDPLTRRAKRQDALEAVADIWRGVAARRQAPPT